MYCYHSENESKNSVYNDLPNDIGLKNESKSLVVDLRALLLLLTSNRGLSLGLGLGHSLAPSLNGTVAKASPRAKLIVAGNVITDTRVAVNALGGT